MVCTIDISFSSKQNSTVMLQVFLWGLTLTFSGMLENLITGSVLEKQIKWDVKLG